MPRAARGRTGATTSLTRTGVWINRAIWAVALIVMAFSAGTVYQLLVAYAVPWWQAWMLAPAVDIALCVGLVGDRALHRHGARVGWGTTLRWTTALITLALNTAGSAITPQGPDIGAVLIHAVAPVLLIVLTEAGQAYQLAFTQLAATAASPEPMAAERTTADGRPAPAAAPVSRPAASERKPAASPSRTAFAAALAQQIRRAPAWRPDYAALMADTGMSRSWCEKRVAEARDLAAIPRLNGNGGRPSPAALAALPDLDLTPSPTS
jgi:hypothetical protein